MDAKLVIVGGKANKSQVSLKLPTVVGRSRDADLTVAHPNISRRHCELHEVDGMLMIRDLGSLNGVFVGNQQVSEAPLPPDSEFSVGPLTFRVEYEYVGKVEVAPKAELNDLPEQVQFEEPEQVQFEEPEQVRAEEVDEVPDFELDSQVASTQGQAVVEEEQTLMEQPAIAPPDGEMPDFSAWENQAAQPAQQPEPDATPAFSPEPPATPQGDEEVDGLSDTVGPPDEDDPDAEEDDGLRNFLRDLQ